MKLSCNATTPQENPDDCTTHEHEDYADTAPHNEPPISSEPEPCGDSPSAEPLPEPVTTSHTFIVDVREFRSALDLAVAEKKTTIPVLINVLLTPVGSTLHIASTDLDKWAITEVPAMIDDDFSS
jgi:hypothetical protein